MDNVEDVEIIPTVVPNWKGFVKRDFPYIVVCLAVLLVCGYVLLQLGDAQATCNEYWSKQWQDKCIGPEKENMILFGGQEYEHKDINQDTKRTSQ